MPAADHLYTNDLAVSALLSSGRVVSGLHDGQARGRCSGGRGPFRVELVGLVLACREEGVGAVPVAVRSDSDGAAKGLAEPDWVW
jgi:hypothetical protein